MNLPNHLDHLSLINPRYRLRGSALICGGKRNLKIEKHAHYAVQKAIRRDGPNITPCIGRRWLTSIDKIEDNVVLWYNTPDQSTHCIVERFNFI